MNLCATFDHFFYEQWLFNASISLRGKSILCTETSDLDNVFAPDALWFGSDTNRNHMVIFDMYLNV